ncbi:MAG: sulfotransferase domain-containing protein [Candidatus Paceibacteria bacterium]
MKRILTKIRKRSDVLRGVLPTALIRKAKTAEEQVVEIVRLLTDVKYKSDYTNIYHCALQKTGTQWMYDILSDPLVYKYSGLSIKRFNIPRRKSQAHKISGIDEPYKKNTIISGVSGTYSNYRKGIPKKDTKHRAFFVIRDPREMVVSWYFSTKSNHIVEPVSMMAVHRKKLNKKSKEDGLKYVIELFEWKGKFEVMRSWMKNKNKKNVKIVKFENLADGDLSCYRSLFDFMDVQIPEKKLKKLVEDYSFESLTGRRNKKEKTDSHMRSGTKKTWNKHLSQEHISILKNKASDITKGFGYTSD